MTLNIGVKMKEYYYCKLIIVSKYTFIFNWHIIVVHMYGIDYGISISYLMFYQQFRAIGKAISPDIYYSFMLGPSKIITHTSY